MPSIHLDNVSFSYSSAIDVLTDVTLHLGPGWVGVIGPNGSGKSTLLSLIAGRLAPTAGSVRIEPATSQPILCAQEVERPDADIEAFAASTQGVARRWIGTLDLDPTQLRRWPTLSPGERKRWQVAAALAADPSVLLLDEPTNHMDRHGRRVLVGALARFSGVGLVVSHDRRLLNDLTGRTIHVDDGAAVAWGGPYRVAKANWEALARDRLAVRERAVREQKKLKRRLADQRRSAEAKQARHKRTLRTVDPKDRDARSMLAKNRHQAGAATAARRMEVTRAAMDRAADTVMSFETRRELGRSLFFDYQPARRRRVLAYEGDLRVGARVLASDVSVEIKREDRVRLTGRNGAGKSTLLAALVDGSDLPEGRLLYLPQELRRSDVAAATDRLAKLPPDRRGRVLNLVAALGVDPDRLLTTDHPSAGEARKLTMAFGLALSAWCLVLDEPTNHLDLPSVEHLEAAIAAYPGAVLIVSHDDTFSDRTTRAEWELADCLVRVVRNAPGA
jgi:ATPase subunit of ABC transporter with duplicated ATPase domains